MQAIEKKKMNSIHKNEMWHLTSLLIGKFIISTIWIYKEKLNTDGLLQKHKGRLVAMEFEQKKGIDYEEIFAPIIKWAMITAMILIATQKNWKLYHEQ